MDFEQLWDKALKRTEMVRARVKALKTNRDTQVPYILLSESTINSGDTVVRRGEVIVEKPSIIVPPNNPQFQGFEFDVESDNLENNIINFLIVRGVTIPSMRYDNRTASLDVFEGGINSAVKFYLNMLQESENVETGLIIGPEEAWQFSLLIYMCSQITKNIDSDIKRLLDEYKKKDKDVS